MTRREAWRWWYLMSVTAGSLVLAANHALATHRPAWAIALGVVCAAQVTVVFLLLRTYLGQPRGQ